MSSMTARKFNSFSEFWPHYVAEHSQPATRLLHLMGTSVGNRLRGLLYCERQMVAVSTGTDSGLWRRVDWPFFYREKQTRNIPTSLMVLHG